MVMITNKSLLSGKEHTIDFPYTAEEFDVRYEKWRQGMLIQNAFPEIGDDLREFIKTGITPEEWNAEFKDSEDS